MKIAFLLLMFFFQFFANGQSVDLNKWLRATIHLTLQEDNDSLKVELKNLVLRGIYKAKEMDSANNIIETNRKTFMGTAIFLTDSNRYYLITARHVLADLSSKDTNHIKSNITLVELNGKINDYKGITVDKNFNYIASSNAERITFGLANDLFNYEDLPYLFSDMETDLAVYDLTVNEPGFIHTLKKRGYRPITLRDIDHRFNSKYGDSIVAIGFPSESKISDNNAPEEYLFYEAAVISRHLVSYGIYTRLIPKSNFFTAAIPTYKGFSGGPIISKNKLIGIDIKSVRITNKTAASFPFDNYFLYEKRFIKANQLIPLLRKLQHKVHSSRVMKKRENFIYNGVPILPD